MRKLVGMRVFLRNVFVHIILMDHECEHSVPSCLVLVSGL